MSANKDSALLAAGSLVSKRKIIKTSNYTAVLQCFLLFKSGLFRELTPKNKQTQDMK